MKNCTEYLELISAYADDELTEVDRRRVEDHLSECESCSALLDLYHEISASGVESGVPAPDALLGGVMAKVLSGEADSEADGAYSEIGTRGNAAKTDDKKKNKVVRLMLTRYLPVAACLALVLLTLPWVINTNNRSDGGRTGESGIAPMMADMFDADAPAEIPAPAPAGGDMAGGMTGGTDGATSRDAGVFGFDEYNADGAPPPAPSAAPQMESSEEITVTIKEGEAESVYTEKSDNDTGALFEPADPADDSSLSLSPTTDARDIFGEFNDAYAWIEVTGPLPKLLNGYKPEPLGDGFSFEMFFKIPSGVAQELIDELRVSQGIVILVNNRDSDYAIVLYSHEG